MEIHFSFLPEHSVLLGFSFRKALSFKKLEPEDNIDDPSFEDDAFIVNIISIGFLFMSIDVVI